MSSFIKKIWKNRTSQFPNKRRLSITEQSGSEMVVYVSREEGTVSEQGDVFSAANMNDLESRIEQAFENTGGGNFVGVRYHASLVDYPDLPCWEDMTAEQKAKYDQSSGATVNFVDDELPSDIIGDTDISAIDDGTLTGIAADHDERLTDAETDIATLNSALTNFYYTVTNSSSSTIDKGNYITVRCNMPASGKYEFVSVRDWKTSDWTVILQKVEPRFNKSGLFAVDFIFYKMESGSATVTCEATVLVCKKGHFLT